MKIKYCGKCCKYTMKEKCQCGGKALLVAPPRYSPDDKYKEMRRKVRWSSS